jgi:uncharacterized integral membrane protein
MVPHDVEGIDFTLRLCRGKAPASIEGVDMSFTVIMALVLTVLVALFSIQNAQQVKVVFFNWYFEGSQVIVLMLAFVVGLVTAALLSVPARMRKSRELAECRRRLKELEKDRKAAAPPQAGLPDGGRTGGPQAGGGW